VGEARRSRAELPGSAPAWPITRAAISGPRRGGLLVCYVGGFAVLVLLPLVDAIKRILHGVLVGEGPQAHCWWRRPIADRIVSWAGECRPIRW
jgi:hypothetical protein